MMFEHIYSKKCKRLAQEQLNNLVFMHYNLMLHHSQTNGVDHDVINLVKIDPSFYRLKELENEVWQAG